MSQKCSKITAYLVLISSDLFCNHKVLAKIASGLNSGSLLTCVPNLEQHFLVTRTPGQVKVGPSIWIQASNYLLFDKKYNFFLIFWRPLVAKIFKKSKSDLAWPRRFQRHPTSLYLAPKVAQRAQKHLFGVVFPILCCPLVAKIVKTGKSNLPWQRRFQRHPTSLYLAPKVTQRAQKHLFGVVFPISWRP